MGQARGVLIAVQARSLNDTDSMTLRDQAGRVQVFRVSPQVAAAPEHPTTGSHLREHMALGLPVIVDYVAEPSGPLAVRITDAASGQ